MWEKGGPERLHFRAVLRVFWWLQRGKLLKLRVQKERQTKG